MVFASIWPIEHTNRVWVIRNDNLWHLSWEDLQGFKILMKKNYYTLFPIFGDFSIKSYDFAPKYLRNTQSANMAHFVAFLKISFQNIVSLKLPCGDYRGYLWLKRTLFTGNIQLSVKKKSAVFALKWTLNIHKLYSSHQSWIFMICIMRKCVI